MPMLNRRVAPSFGVRGFLLCLSLWAGICAACAQDDQRIRIANADVLRFDERLAPGAQRLIGHVAFEHNDATMQCDSAWLYEDQSLKAFGNVVLRQGDSLTLLGQRLHYLGKERTAHLEGDVVLRNADMELHTPELRYELRSAKGHFTRGGKLVSYAGGDTLTSTYGSYFSAQQLFIFSRNVRLVGKERTITADTLHYLPSQRLATFLGPTHIQQPGMEVTCRRGRWDEVNGTADFSMDTKVIAGANVLQADSIHYRQDKGQGYAHGHVCIRDTAQDATVRGDQGYYDRRADRVWVTGHADLRLPMESDTLFTHADTLFGFPDSAGARNFLARPRARFFSPQVQGVCDTLLYAAGDSTIRMFGSPVLWNDGEQISGAHVRVQFAENRPHRSYVTGDACQMGNVDSLHYDQVSSTNMTGYFVNGALSHMLAEGNTRTLYFPKEKKNGLEQVVGVNKAECARLRVELDLDGKKGQVRTVVFLSRPTASFVPLAQVANEDLWLPHAIWRGDERPVDAMDVFRVIVEE
jgi:lipopolysaccharide export system protein LptA